MLNGVSQLVNAFPKRFIGEATRQLGCALGANAAGEATRFGGKLLVRRNGNATEWYHLVAPLS